MGKHNSEKKKTSALKIIGRIFLALLVIIVILAGIGIGYIYTKLGKMTVEEIDETAIGITEETQERLSGYRNIALLGIDSRVDDYGLGNRSDCIIIASLNQETKDIKLISVYRDTYLDIEEHGLDKVTHAYAYGGPRLTLSTLNRNLDLNISEFVTVNFETVRTVVNAIGGVDITVTAAEASQISGISGAEQYRTCRVVAYSRIDVYGRGQRGVSGALFPRVFVRSDFGLVGLCAAQSSAQKAEKGKQSADQRA